MRRATIALLGGLLIFCTNGCGMLALVDSRDFLGHQAQFSDVQRKYTRLVRWNEFVAASASVPPDQRSAYLASLRDLGQIRFTDYETEPPVFDEHVESATVRVHYFAYRADTASAVTLVEEQRWNRDLETGEWHVDHDGAPLTEAHGVGAF